MSARFGRGAVVIVGATSSIARAVAAGFAREGHALRLGGRDDAELASIAADLRIRHGVEVRSFRYDALEPATLDNLDLALEGEVAGVVVAVGVLPDQRAAEVDAAIAREALTVNFAGAVLACEAAARALEPAGRGFIAGIGSVAGDRGRQSNYLYGAAKGGFHVYLDGLRHRLASRGVHVTTIKPGFVDTAMTFGKPGLFLVASPEAVAASMLQAISAHRPVAYVPGFWRWVMALIRALPRPIFERTRL